MSDIRQETIEPACSSCDVYFYLRRHLVPDDMMAMAKQAIKDREELLRQVKALKEEIKRLSYHKNYPICPFDGRIWMTDQSRGGLN